MTSSSTVISYRGNRVTIKDGAGRMISVSADWAIANGYYLPRGGNVHVQQQESAVPDDRLRPCKDCGWDFFPGPDTSKARCRYCHEIVTEAAQAANRPMPWGQWAVHVVLPAMLVWVGLLVIGYLLYKYW